MRFGTFPSTFQRKCFGETLAAFAYHGLTCDQFDIGAVGFGDDAAGFDERAADAIAAEHKNPGTPWAAAAGTFNMAHPDPAHRRAGLEMLRPIASQCRRMGTSMITLCT